jgi:catechol 2,3-dioxygenase-like lactoylglutathione lyase family enzyme
MVRIGAVVMTVSDVGRAADFWKGALGYVSAESNPAFLRPEGPGGEGVRVHLDQTDRMHLDLWASDREEQQAEVERLLALGAERVPWDYPQDADFVVLADPEGNLFCVIDESA